MSHQLQIPESTHHFLASLGILWGIKTLEDHLTLKISGRMINSLGNCRLEAATISLNRTLLDPRNEEVFREVLCHEAAHAAVFLLYGKGCRPHGPEWKALMKTAHYTPRVKIPDREIHGRLSTGKRGRYRYTHRCLNCGKIFRSRRTDRRWRCKTCLNLGLDGFLELVKRQAI